MFCNRCGVTLSENEVSYCEECKKIIANAKLASSQKAREVKTIKETPKDSEQDSVSTSTTTINTLPIIFADFWLRLLAYGFDLVLINTLGIFLICAILIIFGLSWLSLIFMPIIQLAIPFIYSFLLENSALQGTIGKYVFGIVIVDKSFKRCLSLSVIVRNFIKYYFELPFFLIFMLLMVLLTKTPILPKTTEAIKTLVGIVLFLLWLFRFSMAKFTTNKQALHDFFGKTFVVTKIQPSPTRILSGIAFIFLSILTLYINLPRALAIIPKLKVSTSLDSDIKKLNYSNAFFKSFNFPRFTPNDRSLSPKDFHTDNVAKNKGTPSALPTDPTASPASKPQETYKSEPDPADFLLGTDIVNLKRYSSLLRSINAIDRRDGLRGFEVYGSRAKEYLPVIIAALSDNSTLVQIAAVKTLIQFGPVAAPAVPELIKLLKSDNPNLSEVAAQALRNIGTAEAIAALEPPPAQ